MLCTDLIRDHVAIINNDLEFTTLTNTNEVDADNDEFMGISSFLLKNKKTGLVTKTKKLLKTVQKIDSIMQTIY